MSQKHYVMTLNAYIPIFFIPSFSPHQSLLPSTPSFPLDFIAQVAVCNLASLNLSAFVDETNRTYDFKRLYEVTKVVTKNLNKVIDVNFYPVIEVRHYSTTSSHFHSNQCYRAAQNLCVDPDFNFYLSHFPFQFILFHQHPAPFDGIPHLYHRTG